MFKVNNKDTIGVVLGYLSQTIGLFMYVHHFPFFCLNEPALMLFTLYPTIPKGR